MTVNLMEGVTKYGSGGRLRHSGLEETNYIYKNLVTGYPYAFENAIAEKLEQLKIKVMDGLWEWYQTL